MRSFEIIYIVAIPRRGSCTYRGAAAQQTFFVQTAAMTVRLKYICQIAVAEKQIRRIAISQKVSIRISAGGVIHQQQCA